MFVLKFCFHIDNETTFLEPKYIYIRFLNNPQFVPFTGPMVLLYKYLKVISLPICSSCEIFRGTKAISLLIARLYKNTGTGNKCRLPIYIGTYNSVLFVQ